MSYFDLFVMSAIITICLLVILAPTSHVGLEADVKKENEDRLQTMWDQQESFMRLLQEKRNFPEFPTDITSKKGQQFLEGIAFHMMKELFEAGQHLKNAKSHRATEITTVDREAYKEELVDVLHLYIELCIGAGISLDELFDAYVAKGNVNVERINGGY